MRRDAEREIKELDKRKECLRQEVEEMEAATPSLSEGVRTLWKARSDGSREEELGSAIEGLRGRISDLSSQIADCNGRAVGVGMRTGRRVNVAISDHGGAWSAKQI